jgi:hypothetical protein
VSVFSDEHRDRFGVEPMCQVLGVSAFATYDRARGERSVREFEDERLLQRIRDVHAVNYEAYGYLSTWKALRRAGETAPQGSTSSELEALAFHLDADRLSSAGRSS